MTYGFGFWRSGYSTMIPWMWSWNEGKPVPGIAFGGQMLTDSGDELIEWEWESVREGIVDGSYLYTLQEAIVRREGTDDPRLRSLLKDARNLLQEIWNSIPPESKYLADNHWSDGEFESRRAELAAMILKLKEHRRSTGKPHRRFLRMSPAGLRRRTRHRFLKPKTRRQPVPYADSAVCMEDKRRG